MESAIRLARLRPFAPSRDRSFHPSAVTLESRTLGAPGPWSRTDDKLNSDPRPFDRVADEVRSLVAVTDRCDIDAHRGAASATAEAMAPICVSVRPGKIGSEQTCSASSSATGREPC